MPEGACLHRPRYNEVMPPAHKPDRRWFQFSLGWFLALVTLLAIIWWQASSWPLTEELLIWGTISGDRRPGSLMYVTVFPPSSPRSPTITEAVIRGAEWPFATLAVWIIGGATIRYTRRNRVPTS